MHTNGDPEHRTHGDQVGADVTVADCAVVCAPMVHDLVSVLKNLNTRRNIRLKEGKKTTATDDKYLKIAGENLCSELAFALGKDKAEIKQMIADRITV